MKSRYIAENIRTYRERAKLTQQDLADNIGVSWEMVSRYERGKSSPLRKIDNISEALDVPKTYLLEKHIPEGYIRMDYKIPLFTGLPHTNKFSENYTNYFYNCPEWIIKRDIKTIAIDTSLINTEISGFQREGIIYISTQIEPQREDLIVLKDRDQLIVGKYNGNGKFNIIGKIIAQEIRY